MGSCSKVGAVFTHLCKPGAWNMAGAQRVLVGMIEPLDKERAGSKVEKKKKTQTTDFWLIS